MLVFEKYILLYIHSSLFSSFNPLSSVLSCDVIEQHYPEHYFIFFSFPSCLLLRSDFKDLFYWEASDESIFAFFLPILDFSSSFTGVGWKIRSILPESMEFHILNITILDLMQSTIFEMHKNGFVIENVTLSIKIMCTEDIFYSV